MFLPGMFEGGDNNQSLFTQPGPLAGVGVVNADEAVQEMKSLMDFVMAMDSHEAFVIDCFSNTCPPCKRIAPVYADMARQYTADCPKIKFYKINVQGPGQEIASQFEVRAIPTFLGFHKGTLIERFEGADEVRLRSMITKLIDKIPREATF
jgi:thiol-disulfide isomerase/thioredoxin